MVRATSDIPHSCEPGSVLGLNSPTTTFLKGTYSSFLLFFKTKARKRVGKFIVPLEDFTGTKWV